MLYILYIAYILCYELYALCILSFIWRIEIIVKSIFVATVNQAVCLLCDFYWYVTHCVLLIVKLVCHF